MKYNVKQVTSRFRDDDLMVETGCDPDVFLIIKKSHWVKPMFSFTDGVCRLWIMRKIYLVLKSCNLVLIWKVNISLKDVFDMKTVTTVFPLRAWQTFGGTNLNLDDETNSKFLVIRTVLLLNDTGNECQCVAHEPLTNLLKASYKSSSNFGWSWIVL